MGIYRNIRPLMLNMDITLILLNFLKAETSRFCFISSSELMRIIWPQHSFLMLRSALFLVLRSSSSTNPYTSFISASERH